MQGSFRLTNGLYNGSQLSPKYYKTGWTGGSIARIKTYNIAKLGKFAGKMAIGVGVGMDTIGLVNYFNNPESSNIVTPWNFIINTSMTGVGMYIPIISITYFGVDSFYPGRWPGYFLDESTYYEGDPYHYHKD
ncbi:hypothetical protein [Dysgonomonas sp. GY617]|uniref:hypothetical protein n=1 Tax=Dysgonomonas sp. GY617 TaxID=2780420 RepID=UPI00188329C6|nr:hypothetical protein [Dysgonomonas sp. GY617]MBF0575496.1 hypothetical protein [Dysgonomonas sp. GY617]